MPRIPTSSRAEPPLSLIHIFLSDKVNRYDLPFGEKEQDGKYLLSVPFDRGKKRPSGFISGQNVYNLFSDLTIGYHDSLDFLQLPIPFALSLIHIFGRKILE